MHHFMLIFFHNGRHIIQNSIKSDINFKGMGEYLTL